MKPTKQTVYLPVSEFNSSERAICTIGIPDLYGDKVIEEQGYFFTPEELNEYTANVIRKSLETAYENATVIDIPAMRGHEPAVSEDSITDTFDQTYKEFEV